MIYDIDGNIIASSGADTFSDNADMSYGFDEESNCFIFRINRQKLDGTLQFPFVRYIENRVSAIDLAISEGWKFVINAGVDDGLIIENGILISDAISTLHPGILALTIDSNGNLGYTEADTTGKGSTYINAGIVSAVCGFYPIIENYEDFDYPTDIRGTDTANWRNAQRQIIGQFGNGDYAILTCSGRGFDNSTGWTLTQAQTVCKRLGLKFAYNLDGGGSTSTVIEKRQVTPIYEGTVGRLRKLLIVFNGTNTFQIPNA